MDQSQKESACTHPTLDDLIAEVEKRPHNVAAKRTLEFLQRCGRIAILACCIEGAWFAGRALRENTDSDPPIKMEKQNDLLLGPDTPDEHE